jgi:hypothetical protein
MPLSRNQQPAYVRVRDLSKLLGLWPEEAAGIRGCDLAGIVARLARAIRAERRRALTRDWTYDLNRHWALLRAHDAELAALRRYRRGVELQTLAGSLARRPETRP